MEAEMVYTVLDIGAGSRAFGKWLVRANRNIPMSVFCGEPEWGRGPFGGPISEGRSDRVLACEILGVWRIISEYAHFQFPDESLDLVTLNAPHPFWFQECGKMPPELQRCLKPGGLFFSSYPATDIGLVPTDFELLAEGRWHKPGQGVTFAEMPMDRPSRFPQSPTVTHNMRVHWYGDPHAVGTSYIYFGGISPGYRLWRKPI